MPELVGIFTAEMLEDGYPTDIEAQRKQSAAKARYDSTGQHRSPLASEKILSHENKNALLFEV